MSSREPGNPALKKYTKAAEILTENIFSNDANAHAALVQLLREWTERLQLPRLAAYGINENHFNNIVSNCRGSSMKTNPIELTDEEVGLLLGRRL